MRATYAICFERHTRSAGKERPQLGDKQRRAALVRSARVGRRSDGAVHDACGRCAPRKRQPATQRVFHTTAPRTRHALQDPRPVPRLRACPRVSSPAVPQHAPCARFPARRIDARIRSQQNAECTPPAPRARARPRSARLANPLPPVGAMPTKGCSSQIIEVRLK